MTIKERKQLVKELNVLRKKEGKHDGHRNDDYSWCYDCAEVIREEEYTNNGPYNQAIKDIVKLLEDYDQ